MNNPDNCNYYIENNRIVLTETFLKKRGFCCHSGYRYCPFDNEVKMKVYYLLKTSNDLCFELSGEEKIKVPFGDLVVNEYKVKDLDDFALPINIYLNDELYTINYFSKVNSV